MTGGEGNGAIMRSEIAESVSVATRLIADRARFEAIGAELARRNPAVVVVAGRGTSDHAAIYARYLLEHALGVPVALAAASLLTQYGIESASPQSALLAFSQSGAGPDMIALVESAKRRGAYSMRSPMTRTLDSPRQQMPPPTSMPDPSAPLRQPRPTLLS